MDEKLKHYLYGVFKWQYRRDTESFDYNFHKLFSVSDTNNRAKLRTLFPNETQAFDYWFTHGTQAFIDAGLIKQEEGLNYNIILQNM